MLKVLSIFSCHFLSPFPCALDVHGSLRLFFGLDVAVQSSSLCSAARSVENASWNIEAIRCRLGIYVDEVLRAAYGAAENECVSVDVVDLRRLQIWFLKLADPQFKAVFAESQARGVSVTTLLSR